MPNTQRTYADLVANLFQDGQPAGSITPQDMRDLLESMRVPGGKVSLNTAVETAIVTQDVEVKLAGVTDFYPGAVYTGDGGIDNRIVYTGPADRHFIIDANLTLTCASNNKRLEACFAKNGVVLEDTRNDTYFSSPSSVGSLAIHGDVLMSTGDYLEIWTRNHDSIDNITATHIYFRAAGMFI